MTDIAECDGDQPSAPARLPVELIRLIIQNLVLDRPALQACAITCHTWSELCREILFHTVHLDLKEKREDIHIPFISNIDPIAARLETYLQFYSSTPAVVRHVRAIVLKYSPTCNRIFKPKELRAVMSVFPRLLNLELPNCEFVVGDDISPPFIHELEGLSLQFATFDSTQSLLDFLAQFSGLRRLSLNYVEIRSSPLNDQHTFHHFPREPVWHITHLDTMSYVSEAILKMVRGLSALDTLCSLRHIPRKGDLEPLQDLLNEAGRYLSHLEVDYGMIGEDWTGQLDLSPCGALQTLNLGIPPRQLGTRLAHFVDILSQSAPASLREITFNVVFEEEHAQCDSAWPILDELLTGGRFPHLKVFMLREQWINGLIDPQQIEQKLPLACRKRIVYGKYVGRDRFVVGAIFA
ncbi:unnamed protein product [Somion occarium]|uniref:F-box domain-containing protein n=1 Tax=Somion occarium TaxID=3059160 RepID=A0ABP1DK72_9APHY